MKKLNKIDEIYYIEKARSLLSKFYVINPDRLIFDSFRFYSGMEQVSVSFTKKDFFSLMRNFYNISISTKDGTIHDISGS